MMEQLGITKLRPGPSGNAAATNSANYDPAKANPFPDLPDPLKLKDGRRVTTPALWIFGGGHVSKALCQVAAMAGFRVTVADDRANYCSAERFPEAADTRVGEFPDLVAAMPIRANSYCVIVTRGHKEDGVVLAALGQRAAQGAVPRFLGMIGSKTKQAILWKHLRANGVDEGFLARVRTPMGAWIGARSHEEIAVSVVSELIAVRRTGADLARTWEQKPKRRAARGMMTVLGQQPGSEPEAASDGADDAVAGAG